MERLQNWFRQSQILQGNQRNQLSSLPLLQNYNMMSFFGSNTGWKENHLFHWAWSYVLGNHIHKKVDVFSTSFGLNFDPDP